MRRDRRHSKRQEGAFISLIYRHKAQMEEGTNKHRTTNIKPQTDSRRSQMRQSQRRLFKINKQTNEHKA